MAFKDFSVLLSFHLKCHIPQVFPLFITVRYFFLGYYQALCDKSVHVFSDKYTEVL